MSSTASGVGNVGSELDPAMSLAAATKVAALTKQYSSCSLEEEKVNRLALQILGAFQLAHSFSEPRGVFSPAAVHDYLRNVRVITAKEGENLAVYIFSFKEKCAQGSFKIVHFGTRFIEQEGSVRSSEVAIAEPRLSIIKANDHVKNLFVEEVSLLKECESVPGIVHPFNCVEEADPGALLVGGPWMVFPRFNMGDLIDCPGNNLSREDRVSLCYQLLKTVVALKSKQWVHFDIKAENILLHRNVDRTLLSGLTDVSFLTKKGESKSHVKGSIPWLPPELCSLYFRCQQCKARDESVPPELRTIPQGHVTSKIDVWASAIVICDLFAQEVFEPLRMREQGNGAAIIKDRARWFQEGGIPAELQSGFDAVIRRKTEGKIDFMKLKELLSRMLNSSPEERCEPEEALSKFCGVMELAESSQLCAVTASGQGSLESLDGSSRGDSKISETSLPRVPTIPAARLKDTNSQPVMGCETC